MKLKIFDNLKGLLANEDFDKIEFELKGEHQCNPNLVLSTAHSSFKKEEVAVVETNYEAVKEMIKLQLLKGKLHFYEKCVTQNIKISKTKVKEIIQETREELFPSCSDLALSDTFCKTRDESCSQTFMQYKGDFKIPNQSKVDIKGSFVILGSIFMLKQLQENAWFIDATFSIVPSCYFQLLTILVFNTQSQTYIPAAFILMTSKHENCYITAFSALNSVCKGLKLSINPKHIMTDFERSLRNALEWIYPDAELLGCYFHYCRCLWFYAAKHGLKLPSRIITTRKIISLLKILPHLDDNERKEIFQEITESFKSSEKVFKDFLEYYKKNWLTKYSINFESIENNDRLIRTNNICEQYNRRLSQKIQIKHPRLSILIANLIDEEDLFKKKIIGSLSQQHQGTFLNHCSVSKDKALPFSMIVETMTRAKKEKYNFRRILTDDTFKNKLIKICEKCEEFLFEKLKTQAEIDNEHDSQKGNDNIILIIKQIKFIGKKPEENQEEYQEVLEEVKEEIEDLSNSFYELKIESELNQDINYGEDVKVDVKIKR